MYLLARWRCWQRAIFYRQTRFAVTSVIEGNAYVIHRQNSYVFSSGVFFVFRCSPVEEILQLAYDEAAGVFKHHEPTMFMLLMPDCHVWGPKISLAELD